MYISCRYYADSDIKKEVEELLPFLSLLLPQSFLVLLLHLFTSWLLSPSETILVKQYFIMPWHRLSALLSISVVNLNKTFSDSPFLVRPSEGVRLLLAITTGTSMYVVIQLNFMNAWTHFWDYTTTSSAQMRVYTAGFVDSLFYYSRWKFFLVFFIDFPLQSSENHYNAAIRIRTCVRLLVI